MLCYTIFMMNERQQCLILHKANMKSLVMANGCIEWTGTKNKGGYGIIEYTDETGKRRCLPIHRALFMIRRKLELTHYQYVCHTCDNRACLNDNHHWLGNPKLNSDDKLAKGRGSKGFKVPYHHRSKKYSEEHINNAKQSLADGISIKETAIKHGMSYGYVRDINAGIVKKDDWRQYPIRIVISRKSFDAAYKQGRIKFG